ncbi:hypothetical protein [Komagataeibacter diospyri]|uniref:hypothetical protein n=1 Tax=Komagataeibacter diospyri TaxID=1932662 RepID=UPI003756E557
MRTALDLRARFVRLYRACLLWQEHIAAPPVGATAPSRARQNNAFDRMQFLRDYFDEADRATKQQFEMIRLD